MKAIEGIIVHYNSQVSWMFNSQASFIAVTVRLDDIYHTSFTTEGEQGWLPLKDL